MVKPPKPESKTPITNCNVRCRAISYDLGIVNVPGILLTTLLAAGSIGAQTRCGLTLIHDDDRDDFALGLATKVARAGADKNALLHTTEHFAIWYKLGNDPDSLEAPWNAIPNGDSVPRIVRTVGKDMDKAWKYYVDTMGFRAPAAAPTGLAFGGTTPAGLYPVEFCRPEAALRDPKFDTIRVYGLTTSDPTNPERSNVLLSSRVLGSGWSYSLDTGGTLSSSYRLGDGWLKAMRATAVHELLHASQFRYERSLRHFLFEASAVAMEERVLPEVHDHLSYYATLYRHRENGNVPTKGMLVSISDMAYRHGLYLTGLMDERGESILPALWEDRAARAPSDPYGTTILGTMSSTLGGSQGGWRESLIRYGMRILLSGKRRSWGAPWSDPDGFVPWSKAALAPVPTVLSAYPSTPRQWSSWTLAGGDLKFLSDAPIAGDLQVNWVGDSATFLVRLDSLPSGFVRETIPHGTTVIPASRRSRSLWILGSDGTSPFAANPNRSTIASASLSFATPDTAFPVVAGARFRHVFAATGRNEGGQILEGISLVTDSVLPVLDSGLFLPDSILDREGTLLAQSGSRWTLRDSRGKLLLRDATLSFPDRSETKAYVSGGLGWDRLPAANALVFRGDSTTDRTKVQAFQLAWPSLSLVDQTKLILTNAPSVSPLLEKVYPNPSLGDQPVNFRISGNTEGVRLTILASDGGFVRTWTGGEMGLEMAWDLRNAQGNRVRPGVYTWILSGPGLSKRGRLLVAR
jgi:hypothetical protein